MVHPPAESFGVTKRYEIARIVPPNRSRVVYNYFQPIHQPYHEADMAQAIVDPGELRRFAHNLKRFNTEVSTNLSALHGQLLALGDTWRDQEHQQFLQEFEETVGVIEKFLATADLHIPFLLRKAERIEEYLTQR
jgi:hypothetical protein